MRSIIKAAVAATALSTLGLLTPASAHSPVLLAPGQMIGGGWINGPAGAMEDPTSPGSAATDGTLVVMNLDPSVTALAVRKCLDEACSAFARADDADKVMTHAVAPGQSEIVVSDGFAEHLGRYRVDTNGAVPAFGVFRVTGSD